MEENVLTAILYVALGTDIALHSTNLFQGANAILDIRLMTQINV